MDNLLDTHALLWFMDGDETLSSKAKIAIETGNSINYVSIASIWEISIKISLGKLRSNTAFASLAYYLSYNGFQILPVSFQDTLVISSLAFHHKDPFDRMLIAQAINNNLQIISRDGMFSNYNVPIVW